MSSSTATQTLGQEASLQGPLCLYNADPNQRLLLPTRLPPGHPMTPVYSRPGSSSCSQPPTLYSNGPSVLTGLESPATQKPYTVLETDFVADSYFPTTPPLSTAGSSVGSPKTYDVLQTPMNPMFSGLDGLDGSKEGYESTETSVLDWSSCESPPMTPGMLYSSLYLVCTCPTLVFWPVPKPPSASLSSSTSSIHLESARTVKRKCRCLPSNMPLWSFLVLPTFPSWWSLLSHGAPT